MMPHRVIRRRGQAITPTLKRAVHFQHGGHWVRTTHLQMLLMRHRHIQQAPLQHRLASVNRILSDCHLQHQDQATSHRQIQQQYQVRREWMHKLTTTTSLRFSVNSTPSS